MKYNELDLLWLFESDPICSAKVDEYDGIFKYLKKSNGFEMEISFDVYENWLNVYLKYLGNIVFNASLEKITALSRCEENLIVEMENVPILKLGFKNQLSVELISNNK